MNDDELNKIKDSIENLERKVEILLNRSQPRPNFLWKEFWIGFGVVFVIMVIIQILLNNRVLPTKLF